MSENVKVKLTGKDNLSPVLKRAKTSLTLLKGGLIAVGGAIATVAAAGAALAAGMGKSIQVYSSLVTSLKNLKALTGATDAQIKSLSGTIRGMAKGKGAAEVADGFLLIGSEMPHLLKDFDKLSAVAASAFASAKGNAVEFSQAAKTGALIMNAWGLAADQSDRVFNEVGNSIRNGSAFFDDLSGSLKNSAATAAKMEIETSELLTSIQLLAKAGIKGGEAGTGMRAIMLKLGNDFRSHLRPQTVGLITALENLNKAGLSDTEMLKLFGEEHVNTASALLKHIDKAEQLNKKIKEENALTEMAKAQSEALSAKYKELKSALADLGIEIGSILAPALKSLIEAATSLAGTLKLVYKKIAEYPALVQLMTGSFQKLELGLRTVDFLLLQLIGTGKSAATSNTNLGKTADKTAKAFKNQADAFAHLQETLEVNFLRKKYAEDNSFETLAGKATTLAQSVEDAQERFSRLKDELLAVAAVMPRTLNPEVVAKILEKYQQNYRDMLIEQDHFLERSNAAWVDASSGFYSAWENLFMNPTKEGFKSFGDEMVDLAKQLLARLLAVGLSKWLASIFSGTQFGTFLGAGASGVGPGLSNQQINIGAMDTGIIPIGGRASGGPVSKHVPYVVGERGPELFVPRSSGSIIPQLAEAPSNAYAINAPLSLTVNGNAGPDLQQTLRRAGAQWQTQVLQTINQRFGRR